MDILYEINRPSCYNSNDGKIKLNIRDTTGKVFINWLNLPETSFLSDSAKIANNLSSGEYLVEIEDDNFYGKKKKSLSITIPPSEELKFDFIKVTNPLCYRGNGSLDIFWLGGVAPYDIRINSRKFHTDNNSLTINDIESVIISHLSITDSLGCYIEYAEKITIHKDPIIIDVKFDPIAKYSTPSKNVEIIISNAEEPVKIAWYKYYTDSPIVVNQTKLSDILYSGKYLVRVVDANGCYAEKTFKLSEPEPIKVSVHKRADYSFNSYFPPSTIEKLYTTILFPTNTNDTFKNFQLSDKIDIKHKKSNKSYSQIIVSEPYEFNMLNTQYIAIDISPGVDIPIKTNDTYILTYNKEETILYNGFNKRNPQSSRLIIKSIIINDNIKYKFKDNQDFIQIITDNGSEIGQAENILLKNNFYFPNICTRIDINPSNSSDLLNAINRISSISKCSVRSISKKINNEKGQISLTIRGGITLPEGVIIDGYRYKIQCYSHNTRNTSTFYTNSTVTIKDLDKGKYTIDIRDIANNPINFIDGNSCMTDTFDVDILGSILEEQQTMSNNKLSDTIPLGSSIKRFATVRNSPNTGSILINLTKPLDIEISGPNNFLQYFNTNYTLINNLKPGKYTIKHNNRTKDIILFSNQTETINKL